MLTVPQLQTLKAFVFGSPDPAIVAARNAGATFDLANLLNAPSVVGAWRTAVPAAEIDGAVVYTTYDTLTQGKRDEWSIFLAYSPRDMSLGKNRNVVTDVWGGATAGSNSEKVLLASVEFATVAENALGGTTASTGTVSSLRRNWTGQVTQDDARLILSA